MAEVLNILVAHCARSVVDTGAGRLELFTRTIQSLGHAVAQSSLPAVLLVADFPRDGEMAPLKRWLWKCPLPHRIVPMKGPFNKGLALNRLTLLALSENLLFLDADMLVPPELLVRGMEALSARKAWFPGYLAQQRDGTLRPPKAIATGNAFMRRQDILRRGGWPEQEHWGGFDRPVSRWFEAEGLCCEPLETRIPVEGFIHLWHPKGLGWPVQEASHV